MNHANHSNQEKESPKCTHTNLKPFSDSAYGSHPSKRDSLGVAGGGPFFSVIFMGKDPAFLFYPGDWLGGTMLMSRSHKGAYMDILMAQFNAGHLSENQIKILLGSEFESLWDDVLKAKFSIDENGLYYSHRLDLEIQKRRNFTASRVKNLSSHKESHMDSHMENENKDKDINKIKDYFIELGKPLEAEPFFDHFQSNGWKVGGKTAMKDWKAAARNWCRRVKPVEKEEKLKKLFKKGCDRCGGSGFIPPSMKECWCWK